MLSGFSYMMIFNSTTAVNPEEEIVNPEKEKTDLEAWDEQTENEIFDDDDFIGDLDDGN